MTARTLAALVSRVLGLRMAFAGGALMGGLIFAVSASRGAGSALIVATKQGAYTRHSMRGTLDPISSTLPLHLGVSSLGPVGRLGPEPGLEGR